jgi:lipid-binding SYLF domain-containing protein
MVQHNDCWQSLCNQHFEIFFQMKIKRQTMKGFIQLSAITLILSGVIFPQHAFSQTDKDNKLLSDCQYAKSEFVKTDNLMQNLFDKSYGYVIFPNVGKGAIGVGGAAGNGIVFQNGKAIGSASMKQVTVGFQFGGQAYREVIFFENEASLDRFKQNKFEFTARASAVAANKGAAANVKFVNGVMVFTQEKGGLMYEASIGGQKFSYTPF